MNQLITTFRIGQDLFGLDVTRVQEVTGTTNPIPVPLSPAFVRGLINLRGQLATALGLRELFGLPSQATDPMSVVCRVDGALVSLMVDSIGDVVEVSPKNFETAPETIPAAVRAYVTGVYKMDGLFLSVLDLDKLTQELSPSADGSDARLSIK